MTLITFIGTSFAMGCVAAALWFGQREALRRQERVRVVRLDVDPEMPVGAIDPQKFDDAVTEAWLVEARKVALALGETGDVSTDDIWRVCPPPKGADGRKVASVFDRSEWEIIDYKLSARGRNNARKIAVWRRKQVVKEAAE